jgi:hypothetical protein
VLLHARGLDDLVRLKGGLLPGNCPPLILLCVRLTQGMCSFALQRSLVGTPANEFEYPIHPYPPALLELITDLPNGFVELALSNRLSYQVIILLQRSARRMNDSHRGIVDIDVVDFMELSTSVCASPLEQDVGTLVGLFGTLCNTSSSKLSRQTYTRTGQSGWAPVAHLIKRILGAFDGSVELDFIVWATLLVLFMLEHINVAAAEKRACAPQNEREILLRHLTFLDPTLSVDDMRSMVRRYFWWGSLESGFVRMFNMMDGLRVG